MTSFDEEVAGRVRQNGNDDELLRRAHDFMESSLRARYSYNFSWLGRPIIQYPQDIVAVQELIWRIQPRVIVETGIAHGGSLILSASMLELNAACGGPADARVVGVDIEIRPHNRAAIESHPMARRILMIEGSSTDPAVISAVEREVDGLAPVLVLLDSNHTHDHVLAELEAYAPLASVGSYCVVFDTIIEDVAPELLGDRSWGAGNSPKTAVREFLHTHPNFEIDVDVDRKLAFSAAPQGYLTRVS